MNVFSLLGFFLVIYSFQNYKKAFLFFLIFRLFLNQNINLINVPGIPLLTLEFALCFFFWALYLIKRPKLKINKSPFPLKKPFIAIGISLFLSSLLGLAGFGGSISNLVKIIFENYVSIWMIWVLINDKKDYIFLLKGITIMFIGAGVYGLYEALTHANPLMDYEILIAGEGDRVLSWSYIEDSIRGYRIKSFFIHAIGGGLNWVMYFITVAYLYVFHKNFFHIKYSFLIVTAVLSIICMFFTNSRGPILFLLISSLPLINLKKPRSYLIMVIGLVIVISVLSLNNQFAQNIYSIFNQSAQSRVGGSNFEMRIIQFTTALGIFQEYPIFGIGLKGLAYLPEPEMKRLLGLESMWLWIILQQGIVGVFVNLYLIYTLIVKLGLKEKHYLVLFLALSYFVVYTVSSIPGFANYLFYTILFMFIKIKTNGFRI